MIYNDGREFEWDVVQVCRALNYRRWIEKFIKVQETVGELRIEICSSELILSMLIQFPPGEAVNLSSQAVHGVLQRTSFQPFLILPTLKFFQGE